MNKKIPSKYLPLTEATFYILLSLVTPKHGYAVMKDVEEISAGTVRLAPGTLYGALTTLEGNKLISMVDKEDRRKIYRITPKGVQILIEQLSRLKIMVRIADEKSELWQVTAAKDGKQ